MDLRKNPGHFLSGNRQEIIEYNIEEAKLKLLPRRRDANKGSYGKLLVVAGSPGMAGAALLSARAAYRTGCGLVYVDTPEENRCIIQLGLPEAVYIERHDKAADEIKFHAAVFGPGLSRSDDARRILWWGLKNLEIPLVLDADALNLISEDRELSREVRDYPFGKIFTPHQGELSRLLKKDIKTLKENPVKSAMELSSMYDCVCVSKDADTYVCLEGWEPYVCLAGNDGMATGGSGDVLSGIIGGILAQSPGCLFDAAVLGVSIHALSGDNARDKLGARYMLAGDIIEGMSEVLK